jgi:hypothetical protein
MTKMTAAQGYAAARCTGASQAIEIFEIDGDQMRALPTPGYVVKWGYCSHDRLLTPVLPTVAEVAAHIAAQIEGADDAG